MLRIYTDASYDDETRLGCYCLVVCYKGLKDYSVDNADGLKNPTEVELAGLRAALEIARKAGVPSEIYCDNMGALDQIRYEWEHDSSKIVPDALVRHFKGHQFEEHGIITEDVKRHHWADMMAGRALTIRLDEQKTQAYNKA